MTVRGNISKTVVILNRMLKSHFYVFIYREVNLGLHYPKKRILLIACIGLNIVIIACQSKGSVLSEVKCRLQFNFPTPAKIIITNYSKRINSFIPVFSGKGYHTQMEVRVQIVFHPQCPEGQMCDCSGSKPKCAQ